MICSRPTSSTGTFGHPQRAVRREQRREAVVVAHHRRVGELAAQRLDLDAVRDGLKVAHRIPPCHTGPGVPEFPCPLDAVFVSLVRQHNPPECQATRQPQIPVYAFDLKAKVGEDGAEIHANRPGVGPAG
jgi:hypothetical protein